VGMRVCEYVCCVRARVLPYCVEQDEMSSCAQVFVRAHVCLYVCVPQRFST
jgi:hypothetical protein